MYAEERHRHIADTITADGRVSVADLARRFAVTSETVRRDLDALEQRGELRRVHGGAVATSRTSVVEQSLTDRQVQRADAKLAIARVALRMVPATGSVYVDSGTTTGALADLLAQQGSVAPLTVITHAVPVAAALYQAPGIELHVVGGRVRGITSAAVGAGTVAQLADLRPDVAFVGTNGLSAEFGLSTPDELEAAVKQAIVRAARRTVVLADLAKLGEETLHRFAALGEIDTLVTDRRPSPELAAALDAADVEVVLA